MWLDSLAVIRDRNGILLCALGKHLTTSSVLYDEPIAPWTGVSTAIQQLRASQAWLVGDSATLIQWLQSPLTSHVDV